MSPRRRLAAILACALSSACAGRITEPEHLFPRAVVAVSPDSQRAAVGTAVASAPAVRVLDQHGHALSGTVVLFSVLAGQGTLSTTSTRTDVTGVAVAGTWRLGIQVGKNTVNAQVDTLAPVQFTAWAAPGSATALETTFVPETLVVASAVRKAPSVRLRDAFGNGVPGVVVTFTAAAGSGTVATTQAATDSSGSASSGSWVLATRAGRQVLIASTATPITLAETFTAIATAGPPASFAVVSGDGQSGRPGSRLDSALGAKLTDSFGNPVPNVKVVWTSSAADTLEANASTDSLGLSSAVLTLAHVIGARTATAAVAGLAPLTFNIRGLAVTAVFVGGYHACELLSDGSAWCWGQGSRAMYGSGADTVNCTSTCWQTATHVVPGWHFSQLIPLFKANCGFTVTPQRLVCWGSSASGQLGNGVDGEWGAPVATPITVPGGPYASATGFSSHVCGLVAGGQAYCWGDNGAAQLGVGFAGAGVGQPGYDVLAPTLAAQGLSFKAVAVGYTLGCGLDQSNTVYCWGPVSAGDTLGGTTSPYLRPNRVNTSDTFSSITPALFSVCGISANTALVSCWPNQQLPRPTPISTMYDNGVVPLAGNVSFTSISGGFDHFCGITTNGDAACWGTNYHGQLGDGTRTSSNAPVIVKSPVKFKSVQAGAQSSCGVSTDGFVYCWGWNQTLQLGIPNDGSDHLTPVLVP